MHRRRRQLQLCRHLPGCTRLVDDHPDRQRPLVVLDRAQEIGHLLRDRTGLPEIAADLGQEPIEAILPVVLEPVANRLGGHPGAQRAGDLVILGRLPGQQPSQPALTTRPMQQIRDEAIAEQRDGVSAVLVVVLDFHFSSSAPEMSGQAPSLPASWRRIWPHVVFEGASAVATTTRAGAKSDGSRQCNQMPLGSRSDLAEDRPAELVADGFQGGPTRTEAPHGHCHQCKQDSAHRSQAPPHPPNCSRQLDVRAELLGGCLHRTGRLHGGHDPLHVRQAAGQPGGQAVRQQAERHPRRVAVVPRHPRPFRLCPLVRPEPPEPALLRPVYRASIKPCLSPAFLSNVFLAGQRRF